MLSQCIFKMSLPNTTISLRIFAGFERRYFFQGGTPIFPLINVCLFLCVFCVSVAIYIHVVFLSWFCAVRVAVCCVCCVSCMNSSLSFRFSWELLIWTLTARKNYQAMSYSLQLECQMLNPLYLGYKIVKESSSSSRKQSIFGKCF